jgi:hypothetical protein
MTAAVLLFSAAGRRRRIAQLPRTHTLRLQQMTPTLSLLPHTLAATAPATRSDRKRLPPPQALAKHTDSDLEPATVLRAAATARRQAMAPTATVEPLHQLHELEDTVDSAGHHRKTP